MNAPAQGFPAERCAIAFSQEKATEHPGAGVHRRDGLSENAEQVIEVVGPDAEIRNGRDFGGCVTDGGDG